jgi:hypothetical protein
VVAAWAESRPDAKISIGGVQTKLAVDSPRDETKGPFCAGGDRVPGRRTKRTVNKTDLMLRGQGPCVAHERDRKFPRRSPKWPFPKLPAFVSCWPGHAPVPPSGCFCRAFHFSSSLLVLLGLVASRCMGFGRAMHCEAGLCVLGIMMSGCSPRHQRPTVAIVSCIGS